ncbi:hypothetical protein F7230_04070 [Corynebacterium sp. 320]|uniref:EsaB/YukD family protein n=1 Tax=Corynebacterium TaxID=1716 RepID=UPI00125CC277|nr:MULTISPECIES: EsaB/YukD family protein [Corynebacterium]KAB1504263.1 hypothetical protein F7230_04070 [Corynebacterium sp. 320]KAB1552637.1 hypothetical protein F7233_02520 [Corynebacterium sp. 321]KAB1554145.1 hypothetical protein F7232_04065 [Corynebacterium sp. 319]KAB3528399.1 hypothetical protein F8354_04070 [Corynebacterium sp. 250]KAB3540111.1 hypothetical protein F8390_02265 [Corynebacterium sp. 366]
MLAVSISVPRRGTTINAAVADHIPVAELIPHLVEDITPGEHWVLKRAVGSIRPEHTLTDAGVIPGEALELDIASAPAPPAEAVEELSGPIADNPAVWIVAAIAAVVTWQVAPLWHPVDFYSPGNWDQSQLLTVVVGAIAALGLAAASLHDQRFSWIAPIVAFGVGLHINVLCGCVAAALVVWRAGAARVITCTLMLAAVMNFSPGVTLVVTLFALAYAGQIAIAIQRIKLPKVPATGIFSEPVHSSAGAVVDVHSSLISALCVVICACVVQIAPWNSPIDGWTTALLIAVALLGVTARGARPIHAVAVSTMAALVGLWLALHSPAGVVLLGLVALPALRISSPMLGRIIDWVEMLTFALAVPLALHATGVFGLIRGIG